MKIRTRYLFFVILALFVVSFLEVTSFLATKYLQSKGFYYKPSISNGYDSYLSRRDNLLGWPSPDIFGNGGDYDSKGSRIIPSFPDELISESCVSLYGDSFTWSAEVDNEHAWGNVLSTMLNCRVDNYGVGGYGSDQAYLRFRQNSNDGSPIIFLNHLSENILRNVNRYRDLIAPEGGVGFKPRFVLNEEGFLELLSIPTFDPTQYEDVAKHPGKYLQNEYFIPDGPSGITMPSFPYTVSVIKLLELFRIKAILFNEPTYLEFYKKKHASHALETTIAMIKEFNNEAIERGKVPIVAIIPTCSDFLFFEKRHSWPYDILIDELFLNGISAVNFGTGIIKNIQGSDPKLLFGNCSGHYNEEGYKILAKVAYESLMERQLLNNIGPQSKSSVGAYMDSGQKF